MDKRKELKAQIFHDVEYCIYYTDSCNECSVHFPLLPKTECKAHLAKMVEAIMIEDNTPIAQRLKKWIPKCLLGDTANNCRECHYAKLVPIFEDECWEILLSDLEDYKEIIGIKGEELSYD